MLGTGTRVSAEGEHRGWGDSREGAEVAWDLGACRDGRWTVQERDGVGALEGAVSLARETN